MRYNDESSSDLSIITNFFAQHFQSVYQDNSSNVPLNDHQSNSENVISVGNLILSVPEIEKALLEIKADFRVDMDGIAPTILKTCAKSLAFPLQIIFNRSLYNGEFLMSWKRSLITPIYKSGNKQEVLNYRPISKLTTIPKLFEKIVHTKLSNMTKQLISPFQHGFISGRSTSTNLTIFTNYVLCELEKGYQIDVIYTDFSKAFDKVSHSVLLKKLNKIGFHSNFLQWIHSYLHNRIQYVKINNILSLPIYATSGVPQGSHLGPLFFLLFINEIPKLFFNSKCLMYADDLNIFRSIKSEQDCFLLQEDLQRLSDWCLQNDLNLNIAKCQSLSYYRNCSPMAFSYNIDNSPLSVINYKKDLGVIFDKKLNFSKHMDYLVAKGNSMLGFVIRNSKELNDVFALKCLFFAFVRSTLEYCNTVWCPYYEVHALRIEKIQKRFSRVLMYKLRWGIVMPSYETRCKLFGILPLYLRRKYSAILFIRDTLNNHIDCTEILALVNINVPARMLRNQLFFKIPHHRTNYAANEPMARCLKECNTVCDMMDFSERRHSFRIKLLMILNSF